MGKSLFIILCILCYSSIANAWSWVSPYAYCNGNPESAIDPDGRSTWVINQGNGKYQVVGGNLNDNDKNIYVGSFNKKREFVRSYSIEITTSITSFYYSDFTSARDVGNIVAGYIAGVNGMSWEASRMAFDAYQHGIEGISTRNAERYGWTMGYNNTSFNKKMNNLWRSTGSCINSLWKYLTK